MPPRHPPTKWDPDPNDPEVRRWRDNLRRGSASTADAWFRALRRFCGAVEQNPSGLLEMKPKALRDLFLDFATADAKAHKGSTTAYTIKVAYHWLRFNGVSPPSGVKVHDADVVKDETALSHDQLRASLGSASHREKVAILLMAQGGVRPEVLGNFLGTDGLVLGDFPELEHSGRKVRFTRTPTPIEVRRDLSKATHKYLTFAGAEAAGAIVDYLTARVAAGERLDSTSPLYAPLEVGRRVALDERRRFVRTTTIGDAIRLAFRRAGIKDRPYVLRTTAANRFSEAENRGLVSHSYWQFWMGHKGDMSARYSLQRGALPESMVEEMRRAYHRCEPLLSTVRANVDDREALIRAMLALAHVPESALKGKDLLALTPEEMLELGRAHQSGAGAALPSPVAVPGGASPAAAPRPQQVVPVTEMEARLKQGWRLVPGGLNGAVAVLEAP